MEEIDLRTAMNKECDRYNAGMIQWSVKNHFMEGIADKAQEAPPVTHDDWRRLAEWGRKSGFMGVTDDNIEEIMNVIDNKSAERQTVEEKLNAMAEGDASARAEAEAKTEEQMEL